MYRDFFIHSPLLALPIGSLVIFIVVFGRILFGVMRREARAYSDAERLPLAESEDHSHEH